MDLSTAFVARGSAIGGEGSRGLAFAEGEAVVAEGEQDGARWMAFGLDPDGSDLPIRAALPVILRNAIRRLAVAPNQPLKPFYRPGEEIIVRGTELDRASARLRLVRLDEFPFPKGDAQTPRPPFAPTGGPWLVSLSRATSDGPASDWQSAAVDLDAARDITPARPAAVPPPPAPPAPPSDEVASRWMRILLLAAAVLLLLDLAAVRGGQKVARASIRA